ncbi:MAG: sigma 54-interacting transcriptional regulator [Desulfatitalea sp.]|nr:sigma 54-interacting transcriptional regulator [Desulfatitalea sp.]NNK01994.1 sigma 54-interacting transcriptional regulator [Desulfatitalea sp.]
MGSHRQCKFQGRIIAATNRPIDELRKQGAFRDDFYYRLCSDVILIAPLRMRIEEDPTELTELIAYTVTCIIGEPSPPLEKMVHDSLALHLKHNYHWPGNVRELEQCIRSVLIKKGCQRQESAPRLSLEHYLKQGVSQGNIDAQTLVQGYAHLIHQRLGTYEAAAKCLNLDRRIVKKYVDEWQVPS